MTKEERKQNFLLKSIKVHNNKYNYSKVNYINSHTKICIICPIHGEFWQLPKHHIEGHGCPKCMSLYLRKTKQDTLDSFIQKSKNTHGDIYDYSKVNYVNWRTKVIIICPKHGDFKQTPLSHLSGRGCPKCKRSNGEVFVAKSLLNLNIEYIELYKIPVIDQSFTNRKELEIDFYVPKLKLAIEYNGVLHYIPLEHFGGVLKFKNYQQPRDLYIQDFCKEHDIQLLTIPYKYSDYESVNNYIKEYVNKISIK